MNQMAFIVDVYGAFLAGLFAVGTVIEAIERHWWFAIMAASVSALMFFQIVMS